MSPIARTVPWSLGIAVLILAALVLIEVRRHARRSRRAPLARDPADFRALAYRGNAAFFEIDGAAAAAVDWTAALALRDVPEVRVNLERLRRDGRLAADGAGTSGG